jgi:hypothetical protein
VRDALGHAASYARAQLGAEVTNMLVAMDDNMDRLVQAYASHFGVSPQQASANITVGGAVSGPRGLFIFTGAFWWPSGTNESRTIIVVHEWFHVLQNQLAGPAGVIGNTPDSAVPRGGPRWLIEGSAVWFANSVLTSLGGSYANWAAGERASLQAAARNAGYPLSSVETWTGMRAVSGNGYQLGYAAVAALVRMTGAASLAKFWQGIGGGATWQASFELAFGMSVAAFYESFRP